MRTKILPALICLLAFHTGLLLTASADTNDLPITVDPILPRIAILTPPTNAPSRAAGVASFISSASFFGTNAPDLRVATVLLGGGVYTVTITDTASNAYTLGTFSVPTFTNHNILAIPIGQGSFPLPDGLTPTNVVGVSIADSNGVVDLSGAFHGPIVISIPPLEFLDKVILLAATNGAPVNATGRAALLTADGTDVGAPFRAGSGSVTPDINDDATDAVVTVEAVGLPVGPYTVALTDDTGSNTFVLGTLDESPRTNLIGFAQPDFLIFGQSNTTGQAQFPLPDGLTPTNVATISLIDSDSVVKLTGDFARPTNTMHCIFNTLSPLTPGPLCTNLQGNATLQIKTTKGKTHNTISLTAQNAPANQTFDLLVNGISVGTVKSNKRGQISLKKLPPSVDLLNLMTIEADDTQSNVVFSVTF